MNAKVNLESENVVNDEPCVYDVLYQMQERLESQDYMIQAIRSSVNNLKSRGVHKNLLIDIIKELTILEQLNYHNTDYVNGEIKNLKND